MLKRDEIEEKYKWDLTEYFKDLDEWDKTFESIKPEYEKLKKYNGKFGDDKTLKEFLDLEQKLDITTGKLAVFISLKVKEDATIQKYKDRENRLSKYFDDISPSLAFITTQLNEISDERLKALAKNKDFADYDLSLLDIIKNKPHILSEVEEKLLAKVSECIGGAGEVFDMFDSIDVKFDDVKDSKGNTYPLDNASYSLYVRSPDRALRESAFVNLTNAYKYVNQTISANYLNNIKTDCTMAKVRKFNSAFEAALFGEDVDYSVYKSLIDNVNKNLEVFHRYFKIKQKTLGLKDFKNFDVYTELKLKNENKFTYDSSFDVVINALKVLGEDYISVLKKSKQERWIDVMPNLNKDTGAFSWGAYSAHPVVLLNFEGTINSVFTMAHELGHMMHTYYSNNNNPSTKAGYEIFVAEVASTVNEMILAKTLLKSAKTKEEKMYYIDHLANNFYSTLFRQSLFAEFEYDIHKAYENGESVTAESMNKMYMNLNKKYFGKDVTLLDELQYEWSRIPHFYTSFYVYKYATGIICALAIANKILSGEKDAVKNYKTFLSSGCKSDPVSLLKIAGADLTDSTTFENAFMFISSILDEWEKLI